jgi:hypothetical protein
LKGCKALQDLRVHLEKRVRKVQLGQSVQGVFQGPKEKMDPKVPQELKVPQVRGEKLVCKAQ